MREKLKNLVNRLPQVPGVYKFLNAQNQIIYIGKAKKLRNRVGSYFVKQSGAHRKTLRLIQEIADLDYVVVDTELDALLLESNLIKENQPKYNILLKDGKSYPYICVTQERFPRIFSTRRTDDAQHSYYGPFASIQAMHLILDLFKQIFTLRTCNYRLSEKNIAEKKFKLCMEYHVKNCKGPCQALQTEHEYMEDVRQAVRILKGNLTPAKQFFKEKMEKYASSLCFEKAEFYKKKYLLLDKFQNKSLVTNPNISDLEVYTIISEEDFAYVNFLKITNGRIVVSRSVQVKKKLQEPDGEVLAFALLNFRTTFRSDSSKIVVNTLPLLSLPKVEIVVPKIGNLKKLVMLSLKNTRYFKREKETAAQELLKNKHRNHTLLQLKADLNLSVLPRHIECFDNSNIQGTNPVAAMVCFKDGKPAKKEYRHYKIKTVEGPDDFASMYEVVSRRYQRLTQENAPLPQLLLIDGGKGQLSAAANALKNLGLYTKIPVVGIAKRLEEIYYPGDSYPLYLHKKSRALILLQKIRNEAHRFALTFHRNLRSKNSLTTSLEQIEGIGAVSIKKLLTHFKSVQKIKESSPEALAEVVGKSRAEKILMHFGKQH